MKGWKDDSSITNQVLDEKAQTGQRIRGIYKINLLHTYIWLTILLRFPKRKNWFFFFFFSFLTHKSNLNNMTETAQQKYI